MTTPPPLTVLYQDHHGWLLGWLRRKLGDSAQAQDLMHDTFVQLLAARHLPALDNPRAYQSATPRGADTYGQRAYLLASLMARYQLTPQWSLQFNVDNLFDQWYYTSVNFNEQLMWGSPRAYRATATYRF